MGRALWTKHLDSVISATLWTPPEKSNSRKSDTCPPLIFETRRVLSHRHKNMQFTLGKMCPGSGSDDRGRDDAQSVFGNVREKNSAVGWEPRRSAVTSLRPGMSLNPAATEPLTCEDTS